MFRYGLLFLLISLPVISDVIWVENPTRSYYSQKTYLQLPSGVYPGDVMPPDDPVTDYYWGEPYLYNPYWATGKTSMQAFRTKTSSYGVAYRSWAISSSTLEDLHADGYTNAIPSNGDTDEDGIPDDVEESIGTDPNTPTPLVSANYSDTEIVNQSPYNPYYEVLVVDQNGEPKAILEEFTLDARDPNNLTQTTNKRRLLDYGTIPDGWKVIVNERVGGELHNTYEPTPYLPSDRDFFTGTTTPNPTGGTSYASPVDQPYSSTPDVQTQQTVYDYDQAFKDWLQHHSENGTMPTDAQTIINMQGGVTAAAPEIGQAVADSLSTEKDDVNAEFSEVDQQMEQADEYFSAIEEALGTPPEGDHSSWWQGITGQITATRDAIIASLVVDQDALSNFVDAMTGGSSSEWVYLPAGTFNLYGATNPQASIDFGAYPFPIIQLLLNSIMGLAWLGLSFLTCLKLHLWSFS